MPSPWVWILVLAGGLFLAFVSAFARAAAYLDREAYEELLASFDSDRRDAVARFVSDPLALQFAADAFAALLLVGLTATAFALGSHLAGSYGVPLRPAQIACALCVWVAFVFATEVVPRFSRFEWWRNAFLSRPLWVRFCYWLYRPLVAIALRFRPHRPEGTLSDVDGVVERAIETLAETAGISEPIIDRDEADMIRSVLELDQTEVREIMVPRIHIVAIEDTATFDEIREVVRREGHSRLPVYQGDIDHVIGVVHVRDLFLLPPDQQERARLESFLRAPYVVPETKNVAELLKELRTAKSHIAVVVDEHGGTAGIVTLEDIVEEVVGEIGPAGDMDEHPIQQVGRRMWRVSGVVSIADLADELGLDLPDEGFETVSGLIYDQVGGLPEEGQILTHDGLRWTVEKMDGQRIQTVLVTRLPARPGGASEDQSGDEWAPG